MAAPVIWAIGLMSGTSLDGIDVALIRTDGNTIAERGPHITVPFEEETRQRIRELTHGRGDVAAIENEVTAKHADAVRELLKQSGFNAKQVGVIGFHGQTIAHRPHEGITWQIGNGSLLAELTRIDVVCDFRRRDVAAGGQGAPLVPLYHAALAKNLNLPVVVLNLGGIANVSWVGRSESGQSDLLSYDIIAFDTGPGNVMINEWAYKHTGLPMDKNGALASAGKVHEGVLQQYLRDSFFSLHPPKSLDRNHFSPAAVEELSREDGAATLTAFAAQAVAQGAKYFPVPANQWYVSGGGRHNPALMKALSDRLGNVYPVETLGWEGDALEAQAFGFLAVRSLRGLPLSLPTTTGANRPVTGGALYKAGHNLVA